MAQGLPPGSPPPAPQGAGGPPQGGPPPGPGAAPPPGGATPPGPMQFLQQIQKGFAGLAPMIAHAGHQLPPEDVQLFSQAQKLTEAFIQSMTQGPAQGAPGTGGPQAGGKPPMKAPTPPNASPKGSAPSNYGGG